MTNTMRTQKSTTASIRNSVAPTQQEQMWEETTSHARAHHEAHALTGRLYRYHGLRVLDVDGAAVGQIDWVWSDGESGHGTFIGVKLRWLRGTARAVPVQDVEIDMAARTIRLPYRKEQINRAPHCAINRALTGGQKYSIRAHYGHERGAVSRKSIADGLVA